MNVPIYGHNLRRGLIGKSYYRDGGNFRSESISKFFDCINFVRYI